MLRPWLESHCQHRILRILPLCCQQTITHLLASYHWTCPNTEPDEGQGPHFIGPSFLLWNQVLGLKFPRVWLPPSPPILMAEITARFVHKPTQVMRWRGQVSSFQRTRCSFEASASMGQSCAPRNWPLHACVPGWGSPEVERSWSGEGGCELPGGPGGCG